MRLSEAKQAIEQGKEAWLVIPGTSVNKGYAVSKTGEVFVCEESMFHHTDGASAGPRERYGTWEHLLCSIKHAYSDRWELLR